MRRLLLILICLCFVGGCSENSGSSGGDSGGVILPDADFYPSTWVGYFLAGEDDKHIGVPETDDDFDFDDDDIFFTGVIVEDPETEEREVRFIGDTDLIVGSGDAITFDELLPVRTAFFGDLSYYTWDTMGLDSYLADIDTITMSGNIFFLFLFEGLYGDTETEEYWEYQLIRYTTSGISPDIDRIAGTWVIENAFTNENTVSLIITPETATRATIQGEDDPLGNNFEGYIEIRYTVDDNDMDYATYAYDVSLTLNESQQLEGLATYISSMNSEGVVVSDALAIGVSDENYFLTGIAHKEAE